jgi:tetratricopeptide (TPR) repeat protein
VADDDRERDAEQDARLRREGDLARTARSGCPDPDLLVARRSEVLEGDVRERLARHLTTCEACRRLAADFDALALDQVDAVVELRVANRVLAPAAGRWRPWLRAAAVLLVASGVAAAWWVGRPRSVPEVVVTEHGPQLPAPQSAPPSSVAALWAIEPAPVRLALSSLGEHRGDPAAGPDGLALVEALKPYQARRYEEAARRLAAVTRDRPASGEAHFYLGVAQLLTEQPDLAAASLDRAAQTLPASRRLEVAWYQATAEQRAGRPDAARAHLQKVCAAPGAYQAAACAAQSQLR